MATVRLSSIRSRVATALEAITGAGLNQSPLPFDAFGRTPNSIAHKAFAVGIGGSNAMDDRQRPTEGQCFKLIWISPLRSVFVLLTN